MCRGVRVRQLVMAAVVVVGTLIGTVTPAAAVGAASSKHPRSHATRPAARCPWVAQSRQHKATPHHLAEEVLRKLTTAEKISMVILRTQGPIENTNTAVPSLCIPSLVLTDGPDGIADHVGGVTQFPSALSLAATFNTSLAYASGRMEGEETRIKGIDVLQGPDLNLARVPQSGRIFETYGEDPVLAGDLGAADVNGIESTGTIAEIKHLTAYTQETARIRLNQIVSQRTLAELYDAPFATVMSQAHPSAVMCSYGDLNGTNTCADPYIYRLLKAWHFKGFVRSDDYAVTDPASAIDAGLDLIKPADPNLLEHELALGFLTHAALNRAVVTLLTSMFANGLIAHPRHLNLAANATSRAATKLARTIAERSIVLLRNRANLLPLPQSTLSIAVIGSDGSAQAATTGRGSSHVVAASIRPDPLAAIKAAFPSSLVDYVGGDSPSQRVAPLLASDLADGTPLPLAMPARPLTEPGKGDLDIDLAPNVTPYAATAGHPITGPGWSTWHATLRVPASGIYEISLGDAGDTWLRINGHLLIASPGLHAESRWSTTVNLIAHHLYRLTLNWFAVAHQHLPHIGLADVSPQIAEAVTAAKAAAVAVVFAGDVTTEGSDQPSLFLPGDTNALIAAVAAANPNTIVVLNTGGPVLLPWINEVRAVLEAWYPGQQDGAATAAVLDGKVDPGGHLPITFPALFDPSPVPNPVQFPGLDSNVVFSEGLDIGYRWYESHGIKPLYPFGFGLSYTKFRLTQAKLTRDGNALTVRVNLSDTGNRRGTTVVQAYVGYPTTLGEPPRQLRAFQAVTLDAGHSTTVTMKLRPRAFEVYLGGSFHIDPGRYSIDIGTSSADIAKILHYTVAPTRRAHKTVARS